MASDVRLLITPGVSAIGAQQADNNPAGLALRGTRDGAIISQDWVQSMICAGYGFLANFGLGATLVTGLTAFTIGQPSMNLDVAAGKAVIPLWANVYLQTSAGTLSNVIFAISNVLNGNGTSTAASQGPTSMRTDRLVASTSVVRQQYSGNGAVLATNQVELPGHSGYPFADATGAPVKQFGWVPPSQGYPVLIGPASFQSYWFAGTTAPTGYGQLAWIEIPSNWIV